MLGWQCGLGGAGGVQLPSRSGMFGQNVQLIGASLLAGSPNPGKLLAVYGNNEPV